MLNSVTRRYLEECGFYQFRFKDTGHYMSKASGIQMKHNPHSRYFKEFYHTIIPHFLFIS